MKTTIVLATLLTALAVSPALNAEGQNGGGAGGPGKGPGGGHRPPREALDACQGKSAGAACTFTARRGTETGTCFTPRPELPLACRPANAPPPPEAQGSAPNDSQAQ